MASIRLVHFAVAFTCLAVGVGPGCKARQPEPAQSAGLRIDVGKVTFDKRRQRFEVRLKIWNEHDQRITFDLANVRLMWNGREVSAKPGSTRDPAPAVQPKGNQEFRWYFEVGEAAAKGNYTVEIRDILKGDLALGETAIFSINV